eukprot:PhF_6_TR4907/c0_g1_i1/m.6959
MGCGKSHVSHTPQPPITTQTAPSKEPTVKVQRVDRGPIPTAGAPRSSIRARPGKLVLDGDIIGGRTHFGVGMVGGGGGGNTSTGHINNNAVPNSGRSLTGIVPQSYDLMDIEENK